MSYPSLDTVSHLPSHKSVLDGLLHFFKKEGAVAAFVSGSTATGGMDIFSDIDLGVVCKDDMALKDVWDNRWSWDFLPWEHRFDADHIKGHFVIYLFEATGGDDTQLVKADICLYTTENLPPPAGAPYRVLWDDTGKLDNWASAANERKEAKPNWDEVNHEDERFWAWLVYLMLHAYRGELYEATESFSMVREVTMNWYARLAGNEFFNPRRLEERASVDELTQFYHFFPMPSRQSFGRACLSLIDLHKGLREKVTRELGIPPEKLWKTSPRYCEHVSKMAQELCDWES